MIVDWCAHFIKIPMPAGPLRLVGHDASLTSCESINNIQLHGLCSKGAISHLVHLCVVVPATESSAPTPACIQQVLDEFLTSSLSPQACHLGAPVITRFLSFSARNQ